MINLENTTFIIPVYIESQDRLNNSFIVLGYLNKWFKTNIIIHELVDVHTNLNFLNQFKNLNIKHIIENRNGNNYHRTRQLNEMLNLVETDVVSNYDIDVILPIESYKEACRKIFTGESDVVYPYGNGQYQKRVFQSYDKNKFIGTFDISDISKDFDIYGSFAGHCFFIDTRIYKKVGGENENFVAYGPEDFERYERFEKLGLKIDRIDDFIYHFEHSRTEFSSTSNPHFSRNESLISSLRKLSPTELKNYYENVEYKKKYRF